jgi:type I restriction enzyme S subunit
MEVTDVQYKESEIGKIPVDWQVKPIGTEIDLLTGYPFPSDKYVDSGVRLLRGSNVKRGTTDWSHEITQYWERLTPDLIQYVLKEGDIVIAMDGSLVGKSFARLTKEDIPALLLQRVARIRSNKIDLGYLKEFVCSDYFTKHCESVKTVSAIPHISPKDIRSFTIPIPPTKYEQTAIATALSDSDALIENLEKLIAKKQNIKQGVMQELLTGKKRLAGFNGSWKEKKLGDIGKTYGGLSGKSKKDFEDGKYPYIPFLNILNNPIIDCNFFDYVNLRTEEKQNKAYKGDLFFNGSSETPEEVGMCSVLLDNIPNLYLNSFCFGFRLFSEELSNGMFLSYYFRSKEGRKLIYSLAQGATRYNLSKTNFLKLVLRIPEPEEQGAIANVLVLIDREIQSLEQKLYKYQLIKQGMMQTLLTGKIRLV